MEAQTRLFHRGLLYDESSASAPSHHRCFNPSLRAILCRATGRYARADVIKIERREGGEMCRRAVFVRGEGAPSAAIYPDRLFGMGSRAQRDAFNVVEKEVHQNVSN